MNAFKYRNPIKSPAIDGIRDCQILQEGDVYYLTGTTQGFWSKQPNQGVRIHSSTDLLNWTFETLAIESEQVDERAWYKDRFWAPELHRLKGRYFCTFTCCNEKYDLPYAVGYAEAQQVLGPYRVVTDAHPLAEGIDLTFFEDDDGTVYAYWSLHGIIGQEMDLDNGALIDDPFPCLEKSDTGWDSIGIEGPYVIKREGLYYMFYSSWTRGYEIGYATAPHPKGPWTQAENNPFFGAQDQFVCERDGVEYTGDPSSPFIGVGHNAVFTGPDGRDWITCHYQLKDENPELGFDPLNVKEGLITSEGPTHTPQTISWA